jgi:Zn-dependent membrane protease YugP
MKLTGRSKKFRILGQTWTVVIKRPAAKEPLAGQCDKETRTIYLAPSALKSDAINIVAHEVGHAVLWPVDEEHILELARCVSEVAGWVGKVQGGTLTHGYSGRA